MSELANACLRLATVHFLIGGNAGLVDRYEDAGKSACVLAGEGEQMPGHLGGRNVAGESRAVRAREPGARFRDRAKAWSRGCYRRDRLVS